MTGLVQGVGFRPHVYRLAKALGLNGWVMNSAQGLTINLEGPEDAVEAFLPRLENSLPVHAAILEKDIQQLEPTGETSFQIKQSASEGEVVPLILPDIAVCHECLAELFNPQDRRYRYPFINCTHCGPRFSIIDALPYDRPHTSMQSFQQCPDCLKEYRNPNHRRFHAQPNACPVCGPQLAFHRAGNKEPCCEKEAALEAAVRLLQRGEILALKGLGGFQLLVDATQAEAVERLRDRKRRGNKPFALMFPDCQAASLAARISNAERQLLESSESPIVLVEKSVSSFESAAPGNPYLGIFLPYTPLHHLLLNDFPKALIVTSGNLSNEPICIDNEEAFGRLGSIADGFLVHDRPIRRAVDDSVVRLVGGKLQILRRARGYAPLPIRVNKVLPPSLAVGGYLKNTIAAGKSRQIILSQHIGNLDTLESIQAFENTVDDFLKLYELSPESVIVDPHPDYVSAQLARERFNPSKIQSVQHHLAHVFSCMAEQALEPPLLGISWDGTGYGRDGTIWGAESFLVGEASCRRVGTIFPFRLPGGEGSIKETKRIAVSLLHEANCAVDNDEETELLTQLLERQTHAPLCSSMGRLFDGVSSLLGLCQRIQYEGEAAMLLEFAAKQSTSAESYALTFLNQQARPLTFDWRPMIQQIVSELAEGVSGPLIARKFHNTLVAMIVEIAQGLSQKKVILTGGCFQNKLLAEMTMDQLNSTGFDVYTHSHIPPNDGGLAAGQVYATLYESNLSN